MPKRYFLTVTVNRSNKLGEWIAEEVRKKYDHRVVSADEWKHIKEDVMTIMDAGQENFPRCKQLKFSEYQVGGKYDASGYGEHPRLSLQKESYDGTAAFVLDTYIIRED